MVVLLDDPRSGGVSARKVLPRHRLLARLLALRLDRALAAGASPESSMLLAVRAEYLVRPRLRHRVAAELEAVVTVATGDGEPPHTAVPVCWEGVRRSERELRALVGLLEAHAPTSACAMARAWLLITDGTGPLYDPQKARELALAAKAAVDAMVATS